MLGNFESRFESHHILLGIPGAWYGWQWTEPLSIFTVFERDYDRHSATATLRHGDRSDNIICLLSFDRTARS